MELKGSIMNRAEHFLSRLEIQKGWSLDRMAAVELVLCGGGQGMLRTLVLASISMGVKNICLVGDNREDLYEVSDEAAKHIGYSNEVMVRVKSPVTFQLGHSSANHKSIYIIDAGDENLDHFEPQPDETVTFYAHCVGHQGFEFIAIGSDRSAVAAGRKRQPVADRAEIPAVCAQILSGILANLKVCTEMELLSGSALCSIPLPAIPDRLSHLNLMGESIVLAGGGGAVAHQILWAESLDPVLTAVNKKSKFTIVDPKLVHQAARSRQWLYPPESLHGSKARWTAKWVRSAFPGAFVEALEEKVHAGHFQDGAQAAVASIDNWSGRKVLAKLCADNGIPWWSIGSSFFGGFTRQVDDRNPYCRSAYEGVEQLNARPDDDRGPETSCTADDVPEPSSVLPQMVLAGVTASFRRSIILGQQDPKMLARGVEVHLSHGSRVNGYKGLRWSPGRRLNLKPS
jgi:molybdopterin/thiamine biosynthesis adenylyltransferase